MIAEGIPKIMFGMRARKNKIMFGKKKNTPVIEFHMILGIKNISLATLTNIFIP